jgi:hypothetical protein
MCPVSCELRKCRLRSQLPASRFGRRIAAEQGVSNEEKSKETKREKKGKERYYRDGM